MISTSCVIHLKKKKRCISSRRKVSQNISPCYFQALGQLFKTLSGEASDNPLLAPPKETITGGKTFPEHWPAMTRGAQGHSNFAVFSVSGVFLRSIFYLSVLIMLLWPPQFVIGPAQIWFKNKKNIKQVKNLYAGLGVCASIQKDSKCIFS